MSTQRSKIDGSFDRRERCILCGAYVIALDAGTSSRNPLDVLEAQWKIHRNKVPIPEHILVPSVEVENKSFSKFPWLPSCYQRAIVRSDSSSKYDLIGIGPVARLGGQPCHLPGDKNTARISGPNEAPQYDDILFMPFRPAHVRIEPSLYKYIDIGYMLHTHCWEILGYLVGKELIEHILDQVVRATRQYWKDRRWGFLDANTLSRAQRLDRVAYARYKSYIFGCDVFINPWVIPEVQSTIQSAQEIVRKIKRKSPYLSRSPLEIWLLVAEIICPIIYTQSDVQDMRNVLSVFALNLPEVLCTSRLQSKRALFLEVDSVETDSVDWQLLWLGFMGLISDEWYSSSGLANRERVLPSIKGIIANFQPERRLAKK